MHTTLRRPVRLAALAACAALATPAVAQAVDTTIRVEGPDQTIIPESAVYIEGEGTAPVSDATPWPNTNTIDVSRASALWQLMRATSANGVGVDLQHFPAGGGFPASFFVNQIGPTAVGTGWWQFRVNHVDPNISAQDAALTADDGVIWFSSTAMGTRTLEIAPSSDKLERGRSFTVKVTAHAADGTAAPASGAAVAYGQAQGTADPAGNVTFVAQGEGVLGVRASRAGDVRSATRAVCSYVDDPTVCNLPAAVPEPGGPAAPPDAPSPDTVAPGSALTAPAFGTRRGVVRTLTGTAGPDRTDIARVSVSAGLRAGTQCRFRTSSGRLTAARSCAQPEWLDARVAGTRWVLPLGKHPLTKGTWRIETRATDGAGNTESVRIPGANIGAIRVTGAVVRPVARLTSPRAGARVSRVTTLRGTAGPARADIDLVEVAAAVRTARGCRFVSRRGTLTGVRPCGSRVWTTPDTAGSRWTLTPAAALTAGRWTVWSRARGADGTRGAVRAARFTVGAGAAR